MTTKNYHGEFDTRVLTDEDPISFIVANERNYDGIFNKRRKYRVQVREIPEGEKKIFKSASIAFLTARESGVFDKSTRRWNDEDKSDVIHFSRCCQALIVQGYSKAELARYFYSKYCTGGDNITESVIGLWIGAAKNVTRGLLTRAFDGHFLLYGTVKMSQIRQHISLEAQTLVAAHA